jgi:predicted dehydrogenase
MIRVALIGAGDHSRTHHAPALADFQRSHPGAIRIAVCDRDEARAREAQRQFDFEEHFTDADDLRARFQPDAALLITPVPITLSMVRKFLPDAIPLLIEKPLGVNIEEARLLAEAVMEAAVPAMVSLNRRFDPGFAIARKWLAEQGPLRVVHGNMLRVRRAEPQFVWSTGIHLLDLLCVVGRPMKPLTTVGSVRASGADIWRLARLDAAEGPAVSIQIMPNCGKMEESLRLAGDAYCADLWTGTSHPWRVQCYLEGELVLDEQAPADQPLHIRSGSSSETEGFLQAVLGGAPLPGPTVADALASSQVAAALAGGKGC